MRVFLHTDDIPSSLSWHNKFKEIFSNKMPIIHINLNNIDIPFLESSYKNGDLFFARIKHPTQSESPPYLLNRIQPIYGEIDRIFHSRCFPSLQALTLFDDKLKQLQLFVSKNYPTPNTIFLKHLDEMTMSYPVVCKKIHGASSNNVWLAHNEKEINIPCLSQEFHYNSEDVRITIIGNKAFGYIRRNRENDFRASGSGNLFYPNDLPMECLDLAYKISIENNLQDSMCFDFIKSKSGTWLVLEMSYTYVDEYIKNCKYFYIMPEKRKIMKDANVYPENFIVEYFLAKHYNILL